MLSDEASAGLALELAAGIRSMSQELNKGPTSHISGSSCRDPLTSTWALLRHPKTAVFLHPLGSFYFSPSLLRPGLST